MTKFVKAMTYKPKIPAVRSGECRQTIREGDEVCEGDRILFHGWSGLPYRSKWDWRLRVVVSEVIPLWLDYDRGIGITPYKTAVWFEWSDAWSNRLAEKDYIIPPTGLALRDVLVGLNGEISSKPHQIIRW